MHTYVYVHVDLDRSYIHSRHAKTCGGYVEGTHFTQLGYRNTLKSILHELSSIHPTDLVMHRQTCVLTTHHRTDDAYVYYMYAKHNGTLL